MDTFFLETVFDFTVLTFFPCWIIIYPMDHQKELEKIKTITDEIIRKFFVEKIKAGTKISPQITKLLISLAKFTLNGGKRLRAALVFYGYEAFGGKNLKAISYPAATLELLHSFLLIHDDIIDEDLLRRGQPTLHRLYQTIYSPKKTNLSSKTLGNSIAMIAGDINYALAYEIFMKAPLPQGLKTKAFTKLNEMITEVCFGQILDILSPFEKNFSSDDLLKIHTFKTAKYTIEKPLQIGAILAGASDSQIKVFTKIGLPLGVAFQIQDDILGLFGDQKKLGKSNTSDLTQAKKTLLIIYALKKAGADDKKFINRILGSKNISKADLTRIIKIVIKTGSLNYSQLMAEKLVNAATKEIAKAKINKKAKDFLYFISQYLIKREN